MAFEQRFCFSREIIFIGKRFCEDAKILRCPSMIGTETWYDDHSRKVTAAIHDLSKLRFHAAVSRPIDSQPNLRVT